MNNQNMNVTLSRWSNLCNQLNIKADKNEYQRIITAYSEPHRAYHTLQHLSECLAQFDWMVANEEIINSPLLEFALWYHDIVYQTNHSDNELKSAQWATHFLIQQQTDQKTSEQVFSLIIATCHNKELTGNDQQQIVDIDLSILGAETKRFNEYEQQIRKEYQRVPLMLYKYKRKKVLTSFLIKPKIYHGALFYDAYESQARRNILRLIETL